MNRKQGQFGVIYLAFGAPYLAMALHSITSLRVFNPSMPVCVLTNIAERPPNTRWWNSVPESHWVFMDKSTSINRDIKTHIYRFSPFDKTVYLDCDTLVLADLTDLELFLDHFDVLLKPSDRPGKTDRKKKILNGVVPYGNVTHFNSGVLGFRRSANVERFFDDWRECYRRLNFRRDQPSLVEAIYRSDIRIFPLRERWNCSDKWFAKKDLRNDIAIWHYKTRLDRRLERSVVKAVEWFSNEPKHLAEVKAFIKQQRAFRKHRSLKNIFKCLITEMRGPLSKLPDKHLSRVNRKLA
jgi:hypothetical protein